MTRIVTGLIALIVSASWLAATALAQPIVPPAPTGFVNDFAGVIDPAIKTRMETMARNFRDRTDIDIAVVTLDSLEGRPIEETALRIGRSWGIGAGQEKNGLLILVAIQDRRSRIEVSRHLEDEMPDITSDIILRDVRPYFARGDYGEGLERALESTLATIAQARGISIEGIDARRAARTQPRERPTSGISGSKIFSAIVLGIFLLLIFSNLGGGGGGGGGRRRRRRSHADWIIPAILLGGRGGGFRGGGFGGGGGS